MAQDDEDFAALFEASMQDPARQGSGELETGQMVRGTVVAINSDTVFVDIGGRTEAHLELSEILDDSGQPKLAVGDPVRATVAHPGGRTAPKLTLSLGGGGLRTGQLEAALASGAPVEGEFTKAVKSGIEVDLGGVRAFCPASHVELGYVADLGVYEGQHHFFRVIEVREGGRSVIVSRKALLQDEHKQKGEVLLAGLEVGAELDGIVQSIQAYGVFVELGGLQGMVHISELAHTRVSSPSDIVSVGEKVRVKVLSIDAAPTKSGQRRISLSMKALQQPEAKERSVAQVLDATVVKVEQFGLLVETPSGSGLVPTAEIGLPPGSDPRRAYKPGDTLQVALLHKDGGGKLRFSAKAVEEVEANRAFEAFRQDRSPGRGSMGSLGDLLKGKLKLGG